MGLSRKQRRYEKGAARSDINSMFNHAVILKEAGDTAGTRDWWEKDAALLRPVQLAVRTAIIVTILSVVLLLIPAGAMSAAVASGSDHNPSAKIVVLTHAGTTPGEAVLIRILSTTPVMIGWRDLSYRDAPLGYTQVLFPGEQTITTPDVRSSLWGITIIASDGTTQTAPISVHPKEFGKKGDRAALVVVPTYTMRAYDPGDSDRDGRPDTWYAGKRPNGTPLYGPYTAWHGEPWRRAERLLAAFRFMRASNYSIDVISDPDLITLPASTLKMYPVIVFAGHEEYYTLGMWQKTINYRNAGGNLFFMQANNFYSRVTTTDSRLRVIEKAHRTPSRSDYAISGAGYRTCCWPAKRRPTHNVTREALAKLPWLFLNTSLEAGDTLGYVISEADNISEQLSPKNVIVIAKGRIGYNHYTTVTYYRGPRGAEIINLASVGATEQLELDWVPTRIKNAYRQFLQNAWIRLSTP